MFEHKWACAISFLLSSSECFCPPVVQMSSWFWSHSCVTVTEKCHAVLSPVWRCIWDAQPALTSDRSPSSRCLERLLSSGIFQNHAAGCKNLRVRAVSNDFTRRRLKFWGWGKSAHECLKVMTFWCSCCLWVAVEVKLDVCCWRFTSRSRKERCWAWWSWSLAGAPSSPLSSSPAWCTPVRRRSLVGSTSETRSWPLTGRVWWVYRSAPVRASSRYAAALTSAHSLIPVLY